MSDPKPYNPLATENLGASVAEALLKLVPEKLGELKPFRGAGIYAIYYVGRFTPYRQITARNEDGRFGMPIYVGKAIPSGGRKGGVGKAGQTLFARLKEHADSIRATSNLDIDDFFCRHLIVDDIWIPLGESLLIAKFSPIWNNMIDGFGNHDPGKGRHQGMIPRWDVLHPGRHWAGNLQPRRDSAEDIGREVEAHLRVIPEMDGGLPILLSDGNKPSDRE